ncbi:MAG: GNAT family N-acetyltransferase [Alphaproteobacteria bacterium]|nr:GNAT family N-acetyltransferase [Alphaproteobacteria bacterium]MDE6570864.1 GNAT family N-acetyltransferase [Alphaproteobacteria bacterium]
MDIRIEQVFHINDSLLLDCYYIVSEFMGDAENFYYSVQHEVNHSKHPMFVCRQNENVLGFVKGRLGVVGWDAPNVRAAHVDHLYISGRYQRMGIGARLLDAYADYARSNGVNQMMLQSRMTKQALGFYQKHGFNLVDANRMGRMQKSL